MADAKPPKPKTDDGNAALDRYLDLCTADLVSGWAWDREHPEKRLGSDLGLGG